MAQITTTLFKFIQSELIKAEHHEIVKKDTSKYFKPELDFLWFDDELQFTTKILKYDEDVQKIVNDLFSNIKLDNKEHDEHFKKSFILRFINRQINRQTIESFKMILVSTFLTNMDYINRLYTDLDKYVEQTTKGNQTNNQQNTQLNDGKTTTDNRSAFADLPQSSTNLNVDDDVMKHATDNTISKNKQTNQQTNENNTKGNTTNDNKTYQLDELFKSSGLLEQIFDTFDVKCFLQIW